MIFIEKKIVRINTPLIKNAKMNEYGLLTNVLYPNIIK